MEDSTAYIGRRFGEIRAARGLSLQVLADRSGFSRSYLSQIQRGEKPVDKRSTLETLARALGVAPSDLAGRPVAEVLADPATAAAHATIAPLEEALGEIGFGDATVAPRPWPQVATDLTHLDQVLRPATDWAAQGSVVPGLIAELQALVGDPSVPRRDVLVGLISCYRSALAVARNLGVRGLPALATWHARRVAEELDEPAYWGLVTWLRASAIGGADRARAARVADDGINGLARFIGDDDVRQMTGVLHLQASLAAAAMGDADTSAARLTEAAALARPLADGQSGFGELYFDPDNIAIWRMSMAVELGQYGRARELVSGVDPARVLSPGRRAALWSDLGRALAQSKATRVEAVAMLRRAEDIAPVYVRTRPLVRETVTHLQQRLRRDDPVARELRGMAYRMGLAA